MTKLLLLLALFVAALWLVPERKREDAGRTESDSVSATTAAPARPEPEAEAVTPAAAPDDGVADRQDEEHPNLIVAPRRFFPEAKVVARVEERAAGGEFRVIKTVETGMSEPYVVVEELFRGGESPENLVEQTAMVANQLLVAPPEGVGDERLLAALRKAGAVEIKKVGASYLATFPAFPDDPRALDKFKERLVASADFEPVIEPNYIRKIF